MDALRQPPPYLPPGISQQTSHTEDHLDAIAHAYWHTIVKRKWVIAASVVFCLVVSFFVNIMQTPVYEASTELVVEPKMTGDPAQDTAAANLMRDPTFLITQARLISSEKFAARIVDSFEPSEQAALLQSFGRRIAENRKTDFVLSESEKEFLKNWMQRIFSLRQIVQGARILELAVRGYTPGLCARMADAGAETYVLLSHESHIELFKKRFSMTNKSLTEIREKIKTSELALEKINAEIKLYEALKVYGEKYPSVVSLRETIRAHGLQLEESQRSLQQSQAGQRQDMLSLLVKPHLELAGLAAVETDIHNLKSLLEQEIETNREIYNSIYRRLQEMELTGGSSVWVDMKVIRQAGIPSEPVRPNKKMNTLLSLLLGLVLGVSLAFFLEYLDSSVRSLDDVKACLRVNALGIVPEVELDSDALRELAIQTSDDGSSGRIMWSTNDLKIPLYVSEAYRIIRTNFIFGAVDKSLKIFQITSAVKGEGKTTTTVNLGISLSQVGLKVLLVDADLRRPSIHRILHLDDNNRGLEQVLTRQLSLEEAVQTTAIPNLSVLTSGGTPVHPSELLSSQAMKNLLERFKDLYDVVLIDSPPVISVADAPVIASHVDGTLLVVRAGYIPRRLTLQAKKSIEAVNGKILGVVLNSVSAQHHPYYYHRYYTYYGDENQMKKRGKRKSALHRETVGPFEKLKLGMLPLVPKPLQQLWLGGEKPEPSGSMKEPQTSSLPA